MKHNTPLPHRAVQRWTPLAFALFVCLLFIPPARAADPYLRFAAHLNVDCYPDTVLCLPRFADSQTWLPDVILWGRALPGQPPCPQGVAGPPPLPLTQLVYSIADLDGSVSCTRVNTLDSLDDLVFHLWWKKDSLSVVPDTGRSIVMFGQDRLDTMHLIVVNQIASPSQSTPFVARDLRRGMELTDDAVRDLSGVTSYRLEALAVQVQDSVVAPKSVVTAVADSVAVRVFPNPAVATATIGAELHAGTYVVHIVDVSGRVQAEQTVTVQETQQLWQQIDVGALPGGYYIAQIRRGDRILGAHPFTIVR